MTRAQKEFIIQPRMPRATHEGLRPGPLLLEHAELIRSDLKDYLAPKEVPIHPKVYESDLAYTQSFVDQVWAAVSASVATDIAEIERLTGKKLPVAITNGVITGIDEHSGIIAEGTIDFVEEEPFVVTVNSKHRSVNLDSNEDPQVTMGIDQGYSRIITEPHPHHPTPKHKLRKYMVDPEKYNAEGIIVWGLNNYWYRFDLDHVRLVYRNFAIQFNNLGLQRLGVV